MSYTFDGTPGKEAIIISYEKFWDAVSNFRNVAETDREPDQIKRLQKLELALADVASEGLEVHRTIVGVMNFLEEQTPPSKID